MSSVVCAASKSRARDDRLRRISTLKQRIKAVDEVNLDLQLEIKLSKQRIKAVDENAKTQSGKRGFASPNAAVASIKKPKLLASDVEGGH